MRILVAALVTALLVFAIATMVSDLLLPHNAAATKLAVVRQGAAANVSTPSASRRKAKASEIDNEPGASVRTSAKPVRTPIREELPRSLESRHAEDVTSVMREQLAAIRQQEARLAARQESLRMIYDDIRTEQAAVDDLRHQVSREVAEAWRRGTEIARRTPPSERATTSRATPAPVEDLPAPAPPSDALPKPRPLSNATDGQSTREAAFLIRRLAEQGSVDSAVLLLNAMKERDAAKVLAALEKLDPQMAARLTENLQDAQGNIRR